MKKYIKNIQISLCSSCILFLVGGKIPIIPNQYVFANESAISSYSTGITGESDGVIKYGQPQKTIPGNGQPYLISQGLTVYGNKGSSEWIFIADETVTISTLHVFVCGVGNTYIEYTLSISGPGKYVLDASIYGAFNQGLALVINNQPKPQEMTGHVNIHYVDEDGEPLRPQVSLPSRTWLESEATPEYQTLATSLYLTSIEKDGEIYVLDESKIPTNADGSYIAGQTVDVTYVYKLQQTKLSSPTINDKHKIKASADTLFLEKSTASVNSNKKGLNDADLPKTSEANQWKLNTLGGLTLISLVCLFMLKQKR